MSDSVKMRCRKALWWGDGTPAGTCGEPAYGPEKHMRDDDRYWTAPEIARCPQHGGPTIQEFQEWMLRQITM